MSDSSRGDDYDSLIRDERSYDNVQTFLVSRCHKLLSTTWLLSLSISISVSVPPSWSHQTAGLLITANCPCHLFLITLNHCHLWECQFRFCSGKLFSLADSCDQDIRRCGGLQQRYKSPALIDNWILIRFVYCGRCRGKKNLCYSNRSQIDRRENMKHICFYLEINFSKNRINIFLEIV